MSVQHCRAYGSRAPVLRRFGYNAVGRGPRFWAAINRVSPALASAGRLAMVIHTNALHENKTFTHSVVI